MAKKEYNPTEVKTIYRFSISVILTGVFSLLAVLLAGALLFLPLMSANYNDGGVITTYSVTGFDAINVSLGAFGFQFSPASDSFKGFVSVLSADFSSCDNVIIKLFIEYFSFGILALAVVLVAPIILSLLQIINVVKFLLMGKSRNMKSPKGLAKAQFFTTLVLAFIYLIFSMLYQDMLKAIYPGSSVTILNIAYILGAIFLIWIVLALLYNTCLKDRVYVPRFKSYKPVSSLSVENDNEKKNKKDKSKKKEEAPVEKPVAPAPQQQKYEEITVVDEPTPSASEEVADHSSEA